MRLLERLAAKLGIEKAATMRLAMMRLLEAEGIRPGRSPKE